MSTEPTNEAAPSEPWWKKAPEGPIPKWVSPTAARRFRLRQTVLPPRLKARDDANGTPENAS